MRFYILAAVALAFAGCSKDEDPMPCEVPNEEEIITTVELTFTESDGTTVTWTFEDLDGDGGDDPTITSSPLQANTEYNVTVSLMNESESPAEDITEEVEEEAEEHQGFIVIDGVANTLMYNDDDANGNPLGLDFTLTTADAASGTLTYILRHEPDKFATGVAGGDPTNAGGETDVEVEFVFTVE